MNRRQVVSEVELREWLRCNLRARRAVLRMTACAASARAKMSLPHWQRVEGGKCNLTIGTLAKLSTALGVNVEVLLSKPAAPTGGGELTLWIGVKLESVPRAAVLVKRLTVRLRALRLERGLTLDAASRRVGMNLRHWQKIEGGEANVTLQTLVRLASALRVAPADLLAEREARKRAQALNRW